MSKSSFWDSFVPAEAKEARFGLIPEGRSKVFISDVKIVMASQNFHLDDNAKITGIETKKDFEMAFDQEVLAVVFRDEEGCVIVDRRSHIGWLRADSKDADGKIKADAAFIQKHGLKASGSRFINAKGVGAQSKDATDSCKDMASHLFNAAQAKSIAELQDATLVIDVRGTVFNGKDKYDVVGYYPADSVAKPATAKVETPETAPVEEDAVF